MKWAEVPSRDDLVAAYELLTWSRADLTSEQIIKWSQWSRLDARLGELMVAALAGGFTSLNPFELWQRNKASSQPQALLVLLEFAKIKIRAGLSKDDGLAFQNWRQVLVKNIAKTSPQAFFILGGSPKPNREVAVALSSSLPFTKWGFFGSDSMLSDKGAPVQATLLPRADRLKIIKSLIAARKPFSVADYIKACAGRVHRRTAERDLQGHPLLRGRGHTRGKRYAVTFLETARRRFPGK